MANKKSGEKRKLEKNQFLKIGGVILLIVILCLICFFASSSKATPYSGLLGEETTEEGNEILQQAIKDAGEVSDEERTAPKEISVEDYLQLYDQEEKDSLVLVSKPSCEYCKIATPILEHIIYEKKIEINYINPDNFSEEESATFISSDSYFSEGYGTPLLLVVGNHSIKDKIEGLIDENSYLEFMKEYGFME